MPRPVASAKQSRPSTFGGSSLPSSSTTRAVNGGTGRPTDPGMLEPLLGRDLARRAHLGRAVRVDEDRAPPFDHRPLHRDGAGRARVRDEFQAGGVVARRVASSSWSRRTKCVGTITDDSAFQWSIAAQRCFGVEAAEDHDGYADGQQPESRQRSRVVHRPDDEMPVPSWAKGLALVFSRCSATVCPPANIVGGSSVPLGRPVVPDVYKRLGRGRRSVGGSAADASASQRVPVARARGRAESPSDNCRDTGAAGGLQADRGRLGTDEQCGRAGVGEDVGHVVGGEMEIHRHARDAGQERAQVAQQRFGAVLGEHRDPALGPERQRVEARSSPGRGQPRPRPSRGSRARRGARPPSVARGQGGAGRAPRGPPRGEVRSQPRGKSVGPANRIL